MSEREICPDCGKSRCDCIKPSGPWLKDPFAALIAVVCVVAALAALERCAEVLG